MYSKDQDNTCMHEILQIYDSIAEIYVYGESKSDSVA